MKNNIRKFTAEIFNQDIGTNSIVIFKEDEIVVDEYRQPYGRGALCELFSLTKMITSLVTGIAIDKGIISLDDLVISFFPDKLPKFCSENLNRMTIHHLLSMTVGRTEMDYYAISSKTDWVKAFLALPVPFRPGSTYKYSSHTSHIISAIIRLKTGMTLADFAYIHLFRPLSIINYQWETWLDGNTVGGMGLSLSTFDLSRIGQLVRNKGKYKDKRILSEEYIKLATTNHIPKNKIDQINYTNEKYGYSIKFHKKNFYHEGSFGQLLYIIPKTKTVKAVNSKKRKKGLLLDLIDRCILQGNDNYNEEEYTYKLKSILPQIKPIPKIREKFYSTLILPQNAQDIAIIILKSDNKSLSYERIYSNGHSRIVNFDYTKHKKENLIFVKDTAKVLQPAILTACWEDEDTLILNTTCPETPYITVHKFELGSDDKNVRLTFTMSPSLGNLSPNSPIDICLEVK